MYPYAIASISSRLTVERDIFSASEGEKGRKELRRLKPKGKPASEQGSQCVAMRSCANSTVAMLRCSHGPWKFKCACVCVPAS